MLQCPTKWPAFMQQFTLSIGDRVMKRPSVYGVVAAFAVALAFGIGGALVGSDDAAGARTPVSADQFTPKPNMDCAAC